MSYQRPPVCGWFGGNRGAASGPAAGTACGHLAEADEAMIADVRKTATVEGWRKGGVSMISGSGRHLLVRVGVAACGLAAALGLAWRSLSGADVTLILDSW